MEEASLTTSITYNGQVQINYHQPYGLTNVICQVYGLFTSQKRRDAGRGWLSSLPRGLTRVHSGRDV